MTKQLGAWLLGAVAVLIIQNFATGSEIESDPVSASLISSVETITPGAPFTVGVFLKIDPHWHVYWKSSGDAGLPTRVIWKLPDGWTAGPLEWPVPHKFIEKGPMTTYGYEDSVMLLAQITPPAGASGKVTLTAQVDWMVCEETCIPGFATVSLTVPVGKAVVSGQNRFRGATRIEQWRTKLPGELTASAWRVDVNSRPAHGENNAARFDVTVSSTGSMAGEILDWYPVAGKNRAIKELAVKTAKGVVTASFILKSFSGPLKAGEEFESLLIFRDEKGNRRGATIRSTLNPA